MLSRCTPTPTSSCTYVVEGRFAHEDSLGNDGRLEPGAAQVMRFSSAGALHSERNGSPTEGMQVPAVLDPAQPGGPGELGAAAPVREG